MARRVPRGAVLDGPYRPYHTPVMTKRNLFWLLMLLWLIFGLVVPNLGQPHFTWASAGPVLLFLILAVLGWQTFGKPVD